MKRSIGTGAIPKLERLNLIDLSRINAVPYVDFFVTDSAMMTYCGQAAAEIGASYPQLFGDLQAVITHLS